MSRHPDEEVARTITVTVRVTPEFARRLAGLKMPPDKSRADTVRRLVNQAWESR